MDEHPAPRNVLSLQQPDRLRLAFGAICSVHFVLESPLVFVGEGLACSIADRKVSELLRRRVWARVEKLTLPEMDLKSNNDREMVPCRSISLRDVS